MQVAKLECKYVEEVHLCIGVSMKKEFGTILDTLVYTGKTIVSMDNWNMRVQNVKSLPDVKANNWIEEDASVKGKKHLRMQM